MLQLMMVVWAVQLQLSLNAYKCFCCSAVPNIGDARRIVHVERFMVSAVVGSSY